MPVRKIYHVVAAPSGGWSVIKGGSDRASRRFEIKQDAVAWGRQASRSQGSELIVHRKDGTVESKVLSRNNLGELNFHRPNGPGESTGNTRCAAWKVARACTVGGLPRLSRPSRPLPR